MSSTRSQALIHASPSTVWELVGNPSRHPEWWPRVIEVRGERFHEGDNYAQVTKQGKSGTIETTMSVERLDDLREIQMRCETTGTFARWLLTEAQGNTFVDVEFGMDPVGAKNWIFDAALGRLYFRRWLDQSLSALEHVAARRDEGGESSPSAR